MEINEFLSSFSALTGVMTAPLLTIFLMIAVMRLALAGTQWAIEWLKAYAKDARKKKKEEYTAYYDDLLNVQPTRWQILLDKFFEWVNQEPESKPIDYAALSGPERERIKHEMYTGQRAWDESFMRFSEEEWFSSPRGRALFIGDPTRNLNKLTWDELRPGERAAFEDAGFDQAWFDLGKVKPS